LFTYIDNFSLECVNYSVTLKQYTDLCHVLL